jgi:hypothetical protein
MTAKSELMQAREAMAAALDAKWSNVPEWKAFRAIDRALLALETEQADAELPLTPHRVRTRLRLNQPPSYNALADSLLSETKRPVTTSQLMAFIGAHRKLNPDPNKAKINVTSSLSKSPQYRNIPWEGGTAWWYSDRPLPKKETAA